MKKFLFLCAALWVSLWASAQATDLVVDCQTPGWLSSKINYGDQQTVKNLKVTGYINSDDLKFIGSLIQQQVLDGRIDLEDVSVIGNKMERNAFGIKSGIDSVSCFIVPKSLESAVWCLGEWIQRVYSGDTDTPALLVDTLRCSWNLKYIEGKQFGKFINNLIIGGEIDSIPDKGFMKWTRIKTIELGNKMRYIGKNSFQSIPIDRVKFPQTLEFIGDYAFDGHKIRRIILPDSMEYIGGYAFQGVAIDDVKLPITLKTLGNYAFCSYCPDSVCVPQGISKFYMESFGLKSGQVRILPESVIEIDNGTQGAFGVDSLMELYLYSGQVVRINERKYVSVGYRSKGTGSMEEAMEDARKGKANWKVFVPKGMVEKYKTSDYWYRTYTSTQGKTYINYWVYSYWFNGNIQEIVKKVTGLSLNTEYAELSVGDIINISSIISPEDADDKRVRWSSTNPNVCFVSNEGEVIATGCGTAVIICTTEDGGYTAMCTVKVLQHVDALSLNKSSLSVKVGEKEKLQATITPSNADNKNVVWTSSDGEIATVDSDGNVTAVKAGMVTITATAVDNPKIKATCTVIVIQPVTGIKLSEKYFKMKNIGESIQLTATVLPEDASNKKVNWRSSDSSVCIVSNGNVVSVGYGTSVVIVTTEDGDFMTTCTITVEDTTGIIGNKKDNSDTCPTYDVMGRKVQNLVKGQLYIRQGKIFVVQ